MANSICSGKIADDHHISDISNKAWLLLYQMENSLVKFMHFFATPD